MDTLNAQLGTYPDFGLVTNATLGQIDNDLDITYTENPEAKQRWYAMGLFTHYNLNPTYNVTYDVTTMANIFVSSQGRNKYVTPIYQALVNSM